MFPGTFNSGFTAQSASASDSINFQYIDIDYQVLAGCGNQHWWSYSLGARYATLDQSFGVTYPFGPPDGETNVNSAVNFHGVGPKFGLDGERVLCYGHGFRAYGKTSASFLVGKFSSSYEQTNQFNGVEANTSLTVNRIVPILDFELGLAWLSPGEHVRISAGYLVAAWFNTITNPAWIQSVQQTNFSPGSNTVTFDGLTARAEVRF